MNTIESHEDDWDDDTPWLEEPKTTYVEAIARLRSEIASRADARIEWHGKRGPKEDARLAFLNHDGTEKFARRIRSAEHSTIFSDIIKNSHPLPSRHALWYPREDVIAARIVGDYDEMINMLGRRMARLKPGSKTPLDSSLGRDVLGQLAYDGALNTKDPASGSLTARTIRLRTASLELGTLYRRRYQHGSWMSLELRGFAVSDAPSAEQVLVDYGMSFLYEVARSTGVSLRLWDSAYRLTRRMPGTDDGKIRFPVLKYDATPVTLYADANAADRDPLERYLKYYQILEFYMPQAVSNLMAKQFAPSIGKATTPYPSGNKQEDSLGIERNKVAAVVDDAVSSAQITGFLRGSHLLPTLNNQQIIHDVKALATDPMGNPIAGLDYRPDLSERVYGIRCRAVHAKEGGGGKSGDLLLPYSREARDLGADIQVVRFIAERVLRRWAQVLS